MELKPGYKQTDVGVIPEEWVVKRLGDVAILRRDRIDPKSTGSHDFCIELEHIESNNGVLLGSKNTETQSSLKSVFRKGDVLFGKLRAYLRKYWLANRSGVCSTEIWVFVPHGVTITSDYLFQIIKTDHFINAASNSYGTHMPRSDWNVVKNYEMQLPPLPEQRVIAAVLSDTDALIVSLDKLIAKRRDLKQATMQELLAGRKRLPGFKGKWAVSKIGDFTDCAAGGTPSTLINGYWGGSIRWMSSGELHLKMVTEVEGRITNEGLSNSSASILPRKCVLIGLAGQGKTRGTVAMNLVELCTNQSIAAIYPNEHFISEYLYYNLDSRYDELRMLSTGSSGRGGLNLTIIKAIHVPFPELEEQTAIASVLSDMDAEIAAMEARRDKTRALKQGMMQELLTGKTRLV